MSYGSRLASLKRDTIDYITRQVRDHKAYRNKPGDLEIVNGHCQVIEEKVGNMRLENCSVERLTCIADKIHFRPLGDIIKIESNGRAELELPKEPVETEKTEDMDFKIQSGVPLPGTIIKTPEHVAIRKDKQVNYRALPLKDMKVGDCIILHECTKQNINNRYNSARTCIGNFVALMDTKKKFKVAKTDDLKVGVWRIE